MSTTTVTIDKTYFETLLRKANVRRKETHPAMSVDNRTARVLMREEAGARERTP
jgi:hypothetical protein